MIRPTLRLALVSAAALLFFALGGLFNQLRFIGWFYDGILILAFVIDSVRVRRIATTFTITRNVPENVGIGGECSVGVGVHSAYAHPVHMVLREEPDHSLVENGLVEFKLVFRTSRRGSHLKYSICPKRKGDIAFGPIYAKFDGPWRLSTLVREFPAPDTISVYPGLTEMSTFDMLSRRGRLQQLGIKSARLRGGGSEFESLRDYVLGDEYRKMDWNATARRGKLITRQYEAERSQNILICLDTGRTMLQKTGEGTKLDHVIDTTLVLSNIARQAGDNVGLLVFDADVRSFIPPAKGAHQISLILRNLYKLEARLAETDYLAAFEHLRSRWRKRSLIILFTDLIDPDSSSHVANAIPILMGRYRVMCVIVSDPHVHAATVTVPDSLHDVYRHAAALQVLSDRTQAIGILKSMGVWVLDCNPDDLSADLVNRYLEIKERGLI